MRALRIDWTETEDGMGPRPDGYSLHTTPEAAAAYLNAQLEALPTHLPDEYDYPSKGWREPALATPVEIAEDSLLAKDFDDKGNTRIFRTFNDHLGDLYREASRLDATGPDITINYGQTPYSSNEKTAITGARARLEATLLKAQIAMGMTPDIK